MGERNWTLLSMARVEISMTQSSRQQQLEGKQRKLTVIGSTSYSPGVLRRFSKLLLGSMGRIEEIKQNVQLVVE